MKGTKTTTAVLALVAALLVVGVAASGLVQPAEAFLSGLTFRDIDNDNEQECEGSFCVHQGSGDDDIDDFNFDDLNFD